MTGMPADVRARIRSILGVPTPVPADDGDPVVPLGALMTTPEDYRRADARALHAALTDLHTDSGAQTRSALLDALDARDPALGAYMRWIVATGDRHPPPSDPAAAYRELVTAVTALRLLNARREIADLGEYLRDNPDHRPSQARVAELVAYLRGVERTAPEAGRLATAALRREATL